MSALLLAFFYLNSELNFVICGLCRWGNTPAMDVINLACNEKDANRDFSLAFVGLLFKFYYILEWQIFDFGIY